MIIHIQGDGRPLCTYMDEQRIKEQKWEHQIPQVVELIQHMNKVMLGNALSKS